MKKYLGLSLLLFLAGCKSITGVYLEQDREQITLNDGKNSYDFALDESAKKALADAKLGSVIKAKIGKNNELLGLKVISNDSDKICNDTSVMFKRAYITDENARFYTKPFYNDEKSYRADKQSFIVEQVGYFNPDENAYYLRIFGDVTYTKEARFVKSQSVELKNLCANEAKTIKQNPPYTGWVEGIDKDYLVKSNKNGEIYDLLGNFSYYLGGSIHELERNWGPARWINKEVRYIFANKVRFEADGIEAEFDENNFELYPKIESFFKPYTYLKLSRNKAKIFGIEIGKTTKDEIIARFGKPNVNSNEKIVYYLTSNNEYEPENRVVFELKNGVVITLIIHSDAVG